MSSEKAKMLAGELYNPLDPQLSTERQHTRRLLKLLNNASDNPEERDRLIRGLIPKMGQNCWIEPPFYCDYGSNITLGDKVYFNFNCVVLDVAPVIIGSGVLFGPTVQIYTASHPLITSERRLGLESGHMIKIEDDVWVGGGAIICPGVQIGARSVIGAGSVVTKSIPAGVLAVGNPCRVIRQIDE
jgi:maltose O-acetyltransferase